MSYPATGCLKQMSTSVPNYTHARATNLGVATSFVCPAVQLGTAMTSGSVSVRDIHGSQSITCHAEARDRFDGSGLVSASVSSGDAFVGTKVLPLGSIAAPGFFANGSKLVICSMPDTVVEGSSIASYVITET